MMVIKALHRTFKECCIQYGFVCLTLTHCSQSNLINFSPLRAVKTLYTHFFYCSWTFPNVTLNTEKKEIQCIIFKFFVQLIHIFVYVNVQI